MIQSTATSTPTTATTTTATPSPDTNQTSQTGSTGVALNQANPSPTLNGSHHNRIAEQSTTLNSPSETSMPSLSSYGTPSSHTSNTDETTPTPRIDNRSTLGGRPSAATMLDRIGALPFTTDEADEHGDTVASLPTRPVTTSARGRARTRPQPEIAVSHTQTAALRAAFSGESQDTAPPSKPTRFRSPDADRA